MTIADLIRYRLFTERLVRRVSDARLTLEATGTEWRVFVYETTVDDRQFLALVKGDIHDGGTRQLCRVHTGSTLGDTFAATPRDGGRHLREAILQIEQAGRGALVYIAPRGSLQRELDALRVGARDAAPPPPRARRAAPGVRPGRAGAGRPGPPRHPPADEQSA